MQNHDSKEARQGIPLIMWLLLIVVIAGSFLYSLPKILRNYRESGLADTVSEYRSRKSSTQAGEKESVKLYFLIQNISTHELLCEPVSITVSAPVNLNSLLELLIAGPDLPVLSQGYISLIPENTELLGSRIVNHAAYINLSKDFTLYTSSSSSSSSVPKPLAEELAVRQIINTTLSYELIEDVIILIDGKPYISEKLSTLRDGN
ncbi:MAG: GerMN domain-containing protein [Spirochaetia bacterium]|nr:GerMN domain-containing protein [Spirochaetia bacterium]